MKEAWDFDAFVRLYNQLAKERGGWVWPGEIPEQTLRDWYTQMPFSLGDFAESRYQLDQEV